VVVSWTGITGTLANQTDTGVLVQVPRCLRESGVSFPEKKIWDRVCKKSCNLHGAFLTFLNTLTMGTQFPCVPPALQQWERRFYAFPLEMTPGETSREEVRHFRREYIRENRPGIPRRRVLSMWPHYRKMGGANIRLCRKHEGNIKGHVIYTRTLLHNWMFFIACCLFYDHVFVVHIFLFDEYMCSCILKVCVGLCAA